MYTIILNEEEFQALKTAYVSTSADAKQYALLTIVRRATFHQSDWVHKEVKDVHQSR